MNTPKYSSSLMMKHGPLQYSTDASILSHHANGPMFGQVYDDSADEGFILVSAKSGREMRMHIVNTFRNADNDITHWVLESNKEDAKRLSTPVLTITVWNT